MTYIDITHVLWYCRKQYNILREKEEKEMAVLSQKFVVELWWILPLHHMKQFCQGHILSRGFRAPSWLVYPNHHYWCSPLHLLGPELGDDHMADRHSLQYFCFLKGMTELFLPHIPCFKPASKNGNSRKARGVCVQRSHSSVQRMSNVLAELINMYPHSLHSEIQTSKQKNLKWSLYSLGLHF